MAITSAGTQGSSGTPTAGSTLACLTTGTGDGLPDEALMVLVVVGDNISSADGNNNEHTSITNGTLVGTWTKLGEHCNSNGAANAGVTVSVWLFEATAANAVSQTFTVNFSASTGHKVASFWEFAVAAGNSLRLVGSPVTNDTDGSNDYGSVSTSGLGSKEYLHFRGLGKEANSTTQITATASYTPITAARGSNNVNTVMVRGEWIISTTTGETSNPTLAVSGDTAGVFVTLEEYTPGAGTNAGPLVNARRLKSMVGGGMVN